MEMPCMSRHSGAEVETLCHLQKKREQGRERKGAVLPIEFYRDGLKRGQPENDK